jgi:hypothetical protein
MDSKFLTPAAIVVALALSAVPGYAQHRGGGGHGGGGGGARAAAVPRGSAGGTYRGAAVPRGGVGGAYYGGGRFYGGYGGFGYGLRSPYYAFSPRLSLGFGLYLGYPIAYPYWAFPSPYVYGYPYYGYPGYGYPGYGYATPGYGYSTPGYGYPAQGGTSGSAAPAADPNTVTAQPSGGAPAQGQYGGLSFQISPASAGVLVDSVYVGTVSQFTATTQPLTLTPGRHHVEIRAEGYEAMTFDVNVAPGQVLPYQGTMQQLR